MKSGSDRIARLAQGDAQAVSEIYDATSETLFSLALAITGDEKAAEEALLDVYAGLIPAARDEKIVGTLDGWLVRRVRLRALEARRETGAAARRVVAVRVEGQSSIFDAFEKLAPVAREAVERIFFLGASEKEVADDLGCDPYEVRSELTRGMERLGELLFPVPASRGRLRSA